MVTEAGKNVAIVASYEEEGDKLYYLVRGEGLDRIEVFLNAESAYAKTNAGNFDIFIQRQEQTDISALTMIQKLRSSGKYGMELHMLLVNKVTEQMLPIIFEHDLQFIVEEPFTDERLKEKFQHVLNMEKELSAMDRDLRSARAAWYAGAIDFAKEICVRLFKTHGFQEKVLILLGEIALKEGKIQEAHAMFDIVLRTTPDSLVAKHRLANTYMLEKNFAEAAPMLNDLVVSNPLNINVLADAGTVNMEIGDTEHAQAAMSQMLKLDKKDRLANEIMAKIAIAGGQVEDACHFLGSCYTELEMIQFLNNAGAKLSKENDITGAIALYLRCLNIVKGSPYLYAIHYNLGLAYVKLKQSGPAAEQFKSALALKPDFAKAQQALDKIKPAA